MPILPEVRSEMSMNVGRLQDTSGAEQQAAVYGAIGQLSENVGQIATQVARDLHVQAATLDAIEKESKYKAELTEDLDYLSRDPSVDFVKDFVNIGTDFKARSEARRQRLIDNTESYTAKNMLMQKFASAPAEESLALLKVHSNRMQEAKGSSLQKIENSLSEQTLNTKADFIGADQAFKSTMNTTSQAWGEWMRADEYQQFVTKNADITSFNTLRTMLANKKAPQAAIQMLGKSAEPIISQMKLNYRNGLDEFHGIGRKNPDKPGVYNVTMTGNVPLEITVDKAIWDKNEYMLAKNYSQFSENVPVSIEASQGMLKEVSPQMRGRLLDMLMDDLSKRPKIDESIDKKLVSDGIKLGKNGELTDKHYVEIMTSVKPSNLNGADKLELVNIATAKQVQDSINAITANKISRQADIIKEAERILPEVIPAVLEKPELQETLTQLGEGDIEKGKEIAAKQMSSQTMRDDIIASITKKSEKLKADLADDPVATVRKDLNPIPQVRQIRDSLFVQGNIKNANAITNDMAYTLRTERSREKAAIDALQDGFGAQDLPLSKAEASALKSILETNYSDSNTAFTIINNLQSIYSPEDFAKAMDQAGQAGLALNLTLGNLSSRSAVVRANQYFEKNKNTLDKTAKQNITLQIDSSSDIKKYLKTLTNYSNSSQPYIASNTKDDLEKLAYLYVTNEGKNPKDAVERAYNVLVGDNNQVIQTTDGGVTVSTIVPKSWKFEDDDFTSIFANTIGDKDFLRKSLIPIPPAMKEKYGKFGALAQERFYDYVTKNAIIRNSANKAKGFEVGIKGLNGEFIPLTDADGGELTFSPADIKEANVQRKQAETKKGFFQWGETDEMKKAVQNTFAARKITESVSTNKPNPSFMEHIYSFENPNMAQNFGTMYYKNGTYTLGGALTASALVDVLPTLGIQVPNYGKPGEGDNAKKYIAFAQKHIKSYDDYKKVSEAYMGKVMKFLKDDVPPSFAGKMALYDLGWTLGMGATKASNVGKMLKDKVPADKIIEFLSTNPNLSKNFNDNYLKNSRRLRTLKAWMMQN